MLGGAGLSWLMSPRGAHAEVGVLRHTPLARLSRLHCLCRPFDPPLTPGGPPPTQVSEPPLDGSPSAGAPAVVRSGLMCSQERRPDEKHELPADL